MYKDNRNQSFENKLFKINSRSDIQKESTDSKKVDSNVYNNQNIFDDLNNVEKSDSKQNRDSVENVHSIAPNSENEEQGYVSVEKREKSDDSKISESRHSDSREDENNVNKIIDQQEIKIDDNQDNESDSDNEAAQHKLDYKNYIKNLLQDENKDHEEDNHKPTSLISNLASKSINVNVPMNSVKNSKVNEELIFDKDNCNNENENNLFKDLNNDILKMPVTLPRAETDFNNKFSESDHKLSHKAAESDISPVLPENFADLLDGNKNTHEKVVYFSTLNSQDNKADEHVSDLGIQDNEEQ